ncbi:MAG: hypothetical protein EOO39_46655 [Cytophagaceae bacterium]|nr:MAG: hypothetical protein EOO39_46655 [Cytophagaceae bacterium]
MSNKTSYQVKAILYRLLTLPDNDLRKAITGKVYKNKRPVGSKGEDVVINGLPLSGTQFQLSAAIVNIYVPDKDQGTELVQDDARLAELTQLAMTYLTEGAGSGYGFFFANQQDFDEPETGSHYSSIRITFRFFPE